MDEERGQLEEFQKWPFPSTCLIGYKPVNYRIITVRLMGQAKNITLIQVYAPTSASTEEELEEFYETLQKEKDSKKRQDILNIAGDFNAKVGRKRNKEENSTDGNAGLGEKTRERKYLSILHWQTN